MHRRASRPSRGRQAFLPRRHRRRAPGAHGARQPQDLHHGLRRELHLRLRESRTALTACSPRPKSSRVRSANHAVQCTRPRCLWRRRTTPGCHGPRPLSQVVLRQFDLRQCWIAHRGRENMSASRGAQLTSTACSDDAACFRAALHTQDEPPFHGACSQGPGSRLEPCPKSLISLRFEPPGTAIGRTWQSPTGRADPPSWLSYS